MIGVLSERSVSLPHRAQHYELRLPSDLECRNCTLRLIRQAVEWGKSYRFFSCADVDILPREYLAGTVAVGRPTRLQVNIAAWRHIQRRKRRPVRWVRETALRRRD